MVTKAKDVGRKFKTLSFMVERGNREAVEAMVAVVEKEFWKGPPRQGLGKGKKLAGKPWGVVAEVRGSANAAGFVRYKGPMHLLEGSTKRHQITSRGAAGSRAARSVYGASFTMKAGAAKRAVSGPSGYSTAVPHPGKKKQEFFGKVFDDSAKASLKSLAKSERAAIKAAGLDSG